MVKKKTKKSKFNRSALKERLLKRTEESYASKENTGKYGDIFRKDIKIPKWQPKDGDHLFNIIPYIVGENDPKLSEGEVSYVLDIWAHSNVGINEDRYVCPARNYNKPCPICERQKEMRLAGTFTDDETKELNPKRRVVYNVQVFDNAEEENKGVQIWEVSHYLTERLFSELARKPKGGGFISFSDPDTGKMLAFNKKSPMEYVGHKFVDRDESVEDDILEEAKVLDELIYLASYDEIYAAFYGNTQEENDPKSEEETETPKPTLKPKGKKKPKPEPEPEEIEEEEEESEDEWEETDPDEDSDEFEEDPDEDEWEEDDPDTDEDEWEEEEEEEPEPVKSKKKPKKKK